MNILFQAELTDGKVFYTTDTVLRIHVLFQRDTSYCNVLEMKKMDV